MISIKAKEKNLELIFDVDSSMPGEYFGDDKRIRQILLNLLTNAVKYTNQGTVTLTVKCRIEEDSAVLFYSVKDTGIGIRQQDIGKIYDAFQRFDVTRNKNVEGSGLGMNITQQLLKLMGSELQIKSEYEKGSEFSFEITQKVINKNPVGDFREKLMQANSDNYYRTDYIAPQARVLVVDDYKMNLKVFKNLLKQTQMLIFEAESGRECLNMLKSQVFDLIFLDHMMPEMDGIETLHAIRENHLCTGVPIIMLTANAIVGDREKYIGEGFNDFLSKPILPDKLDKMILHYLPQELVTFGKDIKASDERDVFVEEQREEVVTSEESVQFKSSVLSELSQALPEIDVRAGLATCSNDEEFYLELLQDFTELSTKEELIKYFADSNHQNYCIRVHGFKNNAYSVGASKLGNLAYEMEKQTREGFTEEIVLLQKQLFEQYDRICLKYNEIVLARKGD